MIILLDKIVSEISPDLIPLCAAGDCFFDSLEIAMLHFVHEGANYHLMDIEPYAFTKLQKSFALLDGLLGSFFLSVNV